jgi:hypothetical protein
MRTGAGSKVSAPERIAFALSRAERHRCGMLKRRTDLLRLPARAAAPSQSQVAVSGARPGAETLQPLLSVELLELLTASLRTQACSSAEQVKLVGQVGAAWVHAGTQMPGGLPVSAQHL